MRVVLSANTDWYLYNFRFSLARFLREQGYQVLLVSPPGEFVLRLTQAGFEWHSWRVGRQSLSPFREITSLRELRDIYRQVKPDLVHHHTIKPVLYGSLAAQLARVPCLVNSITGRGYVYQSRQAKASILRPFTNLLYRYVFRHSNVAAIFENQTDQDYFISHKIIPATRAWLVSGVGVDPEIFTPAPEPDGTPIVLLSSRMLWDKGVGILVEAARILRSHLSVRVVLVGDPDPGNPASIAVEQLQKWVAEGVVEWWGWQADMQAVYKRAHIVTLPTMYGEGVPTSLLEAAASGKPIVATDFPGCRDIVIDEINGLLVPPDEPQALARALERLVLNPGLRGRMGSAGRELVLDKFTINQINTQTMLIYQKVINRS